MNFLKSSIFRYLILCCALIFIWFFTGKIIATGESAVPFYNYTSLVSLVSYTWTPSALGFPSSFTVAAWPAYVLTVFLAQILHAGYLVQGVEFLVLLVISGIFAEKYVTFSLHKWEIGFISSIFYIFNLFVIPNVWGRLQYPYIFFYCSLPLFFFLFSRGFNEKKKIVLPIITILFFLFSIQFASIPLLELFWIIEGLYFLFFILLNFRNKQEVIYAFLFFISTFFCWIISNFWWFFQFVVSLKNTSYITSTGYTASGDINTLIALSQNLGNLSYIFRLMHRDFFESMQTVWGPIYFRSPFIVLSFAIPFLAFAPLLFKKKPKILYFYLGLSLLLIFLMKGSADPFGELSLEIFSHVRIFEAFRNSFEKFGLALPFAYAPLIGFSMYKLLLVIKKHSQAYFFIGFFVSSLILLFGILVFPMWNRWVFTSDIPPANNLRIGDYVTIPAYYSQANMWLNEDKNEFRNIALPIGGEGITYNWQYGYSGVELSNSMFDKPFISLSTTIQFLSTLANQEEYTLVKYPQYMSKVMSILNAKYLMVRSDIDYKSRDMKNPSYFLYMLTPTTANAIPDISYAKTFGKLNFYLNNRPSPKIYPVTGGYYASDSIPLADIFSLSDFADQDAIFNPTTSFKANSFLSKYTKQAFYLPESDLDSELYSGLSLKEAYANIPYTGVFPNSIFYPFVKFLEQITLSSQHDQNKQLFMYISNTEKRLGYLQKGIDQKNIDLSIKAAEEYKAYLQYFINSMNSSEQKIFTANKASVGRKLLLETIILNDLSHKTGDQNTQKMITQSNSILTDFLTANTILPKNLPQITDTPWKEYLFIVPEDGMYQIEMQNDDFNTYYTASDFYQMQLNDSLNTIQPDFTNAWVSLGEYHFKKGRNEVFAYTPPKKNLVGSLLPQPDILSASEGLHREFTINEFDAYSSYTVHVEYKISGNGCFAVDVLTDVNPELNSKQGCGNALHGWQIRNIDFTPSTAPTMAKLQLLLDDKDHKTSVEYKNIQVFRKFTNMILLAKHRNSIPKVAVPSISFTKINPSEYIAHIKYAQNPFFLVFSESFHPLWTARYTSGQQISSSMHFLVNTYANAWYVEKKGNYDITLEFTAEHDFFLGKIFSIIAGSVLLLFTLLYILYRRRKYESSS